MLFVTKTIENAELVSPDELKVYFHIRYLLEPYKSEKRVAPIYNAGDMNDLDQLHMHIKTSHISSSIEAVNKARKFLADSNYNVYG